MPTTVSVPDVLVSTDWVAQHRNDPNVRVVEVDVDYHPRAAGTRSKVTGTLRGTLRAVRDMSVVLAR